MIRLGIVDFDSSHSVEFTRRFNHVGIDADQFVEGARVAFGCPGTSDMSPERIPFFSDQIAACGVEIVEKAEAMIGRIDAVLILSLEGGVHRERVRPFLEAGVPAYVDKPFACSFADAAEMVRLAEEHGTTLFHASALRYADEVERFLKRNDEYGPLYGAVAYGPVKRDQRNPGLFHYGIHPTSILFALMGPGCRQSATTHTDDADVVTGLWVDGRAATVRGSRRGATAYGFVAFCEQGVIHQPVSTRYAYRNLCRRIVQAFETGQPAESNELSLETVRFVLAALKSERGRGEPVALDSISQ